MGKFILILILMSNFLGAGAQDLIINGGFETMTACPLEPGDMYMAKNWHTQEGTPDFYHKCAEKQHIGVNALRNFEGYRSPYSGEGCMGVYVIYYQKFLTEKQAYGKVETVYTKLYKPLTVGKKYLFSFYISISDSCNVFVDSIYVTFNNKSPAGASKQVLRKGLTKGLFISNALTWHQVQVEIFASDPFAYVSIGLPRDKITFASYKNMIHNTLTTKKITKDRPLTAYYYLDNISLVEIR